MHERRIFLSASSKKGASGSFFVGSEILLPEDKIHHLLRVLRLKEGSVITVVNTDDGKEFEAVIATKSSIKIICEVKTKEFITRVDSLIFAACKGDTNELVAEKATELGVNRIIFWNAARSVQKLEIDSGKHKRLIKIVESACQQSGRKTIPSILIANSPKDISLKLNNSGVKFICSLHPESKLLRDFEAFNTPASILIGPEGDFTAEEEGEFIADNFKRLSLGDLRLCAETAAIVGVSILQLY